jgi:hypothetical protein
LTDELGGGPDARQGARPVVLCTVLGVAAFAITFCGAVLLGRGLAGSGLAALLIPLALSGALAVGVAVTFVVAVAVEHPLGHRRVSRAVTVVAPLAALVALFAYAADPAGQAGRPLAQAGGLPSSGDGTQPRVPSRTISVPRTPRVPAPGEPVVVAGPARPAGVVTVRPVAAAPARPAPDRGERPVALAKSPAVDPLDFVGKSPRSLASAGKAKPGCGKKQPRSCRGHSTNRWRA